LQICIIELITKISSSNSLLLLEYL